MTGKAFYAPDGGAVIVFHPRDGLSVHAPGRGSAAVSCAAGVFEILNKDGCPFKLEPPPPAPVPSPFARRRLTADELDALRRAWPEDGTAWLLSRGVTPFVLSTTDPDLAHYRGQLGFLRDGKSRNRTPQRTVANSLAGTGILVRWWGEAVAAVRRSMTTVNGFTLIIFKGVEEATNSRAYRWVDEREDEADLLELVWEGWLKYHPGTRYSPPKEIRWVKTGTA